VQAVLPLRPDEHPNWRSSVPFLLAHLAPLAIVFTGVTAKAVILGVVLYVVRMFFITAGYHRYFAHRSYKLGRVAQFVMAFGGTTAAQKGPLWWAANHRIHHRESDTEADVHTPLKGFWHSHVGWILADRHGPTDLDGIRDFAKFPELRFLNKHDWIGPWTLGVASFLIAGWSGLVVGFFCSTILLWHATFAVNSLAHVFGRRRYATTDTSRNSLLIALMTGGEGWHNNHHYYAPSCRNGFFWWEWDPSFYILKVLSWLGIVKDMKTVPAWARDANRVKEGTFDIGMFRLSWNKAAGTLHAATAHVGDYVHDKRVNAGEALAGRREALTEKRHAVEENIHQRREALEGFVRSSMESAEELAKATRRGNRELAGDSG
jgi:stearoyl-CoA desaturase (Delta-9 desaturase)